VRPVEAEAGPDRPAQERVHRHPEGARVDVQERVLDRPDGLLDHAARGLPTKRVHEGDVGFPGPRILADQDGSQLGDDRGDAEAAEGLVVLAPADDALVGADLEEVEVSPTRVGVERFDLGDLHDA
jgi:hypothetical protein